MTCASGCLWGSVQRALTCRVVTCGRGRRLAQNVIRTTPQSGQYGRELGKGTLRVPDSPEWICTCLSPASAYIRAQHCWPFKEHLMLATLQETFKPSEQDWACLWGTQFLRLSNYCVIWVSSIQMDIFGQPNSYSVSQLNMSPFITYIWVLLVQFLWRPG